MENSKANFIPFPRNHIINTILFKIFFLIVIIYYSTRNFLVSIILFMVYMLTYSKNIVVESFSTKKKKKKKKNKKVKEKFLQDVPKDIFSGKINGNIKGGGYLDIDQNIKKLDMALKTFENNLN